MLHPRLKTRKCLSYRLSVSKASVKTGLSERSTDTAQLLSKVHREQSGSWRALVEGTPCSTETAAGEHGPERKLLGHCTDMVLRENKQIPPRNESERKHRPEERLRQPSK